MSQHSVVRLLLRSAAIAIAVAALIDPAMTSRRASKPIVALIAGDQHDSVLVNRVARTLDKSFVVIRSPAPNADATVVAGDAPPHGIDALAGPLFAVLSDRDGPTVTLDAVHAPSWTPADARAPITVDAHVTGARGHTVEVSLRRGDLVVDRATREIAIDDERVPLSLAFVPTAVGAVPLRISAAVDGARLPATADVVVDVRGTRWPVLFFDPRPSWMSTFVRRALERDPRFVVTSRIVTSRNVSADAGNPPGHLDDLAALELFDAVVVGAPEALTANDVAGLDDFMRRRGGRVVLLFDRRVSGPYERLTKTSNWSTDASGKTISLALVAGDTGSLHASEVVWPARLPEGAESVADAADHPIVWQSAVGAGQLVVSGALDAWRFRDQPGFDRFWQTLIADAASAAPPPIEVSVEHSTIAPGDETAVTVSVRDAALSTRSNIETSVAATLESSQPGIAPAVVRLWPDATPGQFRGVIRGGTPGDYRLVVASGGARSETPLVVARDASQPATEARDLLAAWARVRGGQAMPVSRVTCIPATLTEAIHPTPHSETWHPMRSVWWIVPFALLLSGEWWLRRRRGLA